MGHHYRRRNSSAKFSCDGFGRISPRHAPQFFDVFFSLGTHHDLDQLCSGNWTVSAHGLLQI